MGSFQGKVYNTPAEAEEFINSTIETYPVVMFSKIYCPYCIKAKTAFNSINVNYHHVELYRRPDCEVLQDALLKITGARTVPRVFIHQKCIGGGNETRDLLKNNRLKDLVDGKETFEGPKERASKY